MSLLRVSRVDAGFTQKPVETSQGFLKLTGFASRVGVFEYLNEDGTIRRELRLPEEVFHPDSLASYEGAPFTIGHPGTVTKRNAKRVTSGFVMKAASKADDGEHVAVEILATDSEAIDAMKSAKRRELSSGYSLDLEMVSGTHPLFGRYDAIQRNIRINHLALVERGRAGKTARVHMDQLRADGFSGHAVMVRSDDPMHGDQRRVTGSTIGGTDRMGKQKEERLDIEAVEREISTHKQRADELATKLDAETKRADALAGKVTGLEQQLKDAQTENADLARVDELEAQVTELTEERDTLKVKLDEALNPQKRADAVKERVALLETARAVLGAVENLDEMSDRDLMTLVIEKRGGKVEEKHSDEHVRGAFDGHVAGFVRGSRSLAKLRAASTVITEDGAPVVKKTARDEYIERQRNGWQSQKGA